ncbi:MAG: phage terminase large subunit [Neisseria sp.]|nr:phage terminase large subunit [Neisseria sp.]
MIEFSDAELQAVSYLAPESLYLFARYMFAVRRGMRWQEAKHHVLICEALERVYKGQTKRLIINIPPRYSKTELAVVNFIAWSLGKSPDCEFIHASYSATLAVNNSVQIRNMVQHEAYRQIFPNVVLEEEAKAHWKTSAGGVMYATGAAGTITGFGAGKFREGFGGCIIIDDPHKADEARSETMRNNVIDWFQNTVESRKNSPDTPIVIIMQRLHEDDLSGWLLGGGNGEKWEHLCLSAIQEDGTALWPEKHDIATLRTMEQAAPYMFAGQYRQRPAPPEGGLFKPDQIRIVKAMPSENIRWLRGWDLASTAGDGDYTAGAKVGVRDDGKVFIADIVRGRFSADERDNVLVQTAQTDGRQTKISLPQDPGQAGKSQVLYLTRKLAGFSVSSSPESGDKVTRAEPFAAQVNVGNVVLVDNGNWDVQALLNEMRLFPNGRHDDQIDALSRAFNELLTKRGNVSRREFLL